MKTITKLINADTNVGQKDRYIRLLIGAGLISIPLLYTGNNTEYVALAALVAIPFLYTSMVSSCPIYTIIGFNSNQDEVTSTNFNDRNISVTDAILRYTTGAVLILMAMLFAGVSEFIVLLALAAIPIVQSAITLWDPVYAMFKTGTYYQSRNVTSRDSDVIQMDSFIGNDTQPNIMTGGENKAA